jgi:hypothetical protein
MSHLTRTQILNAIGGAQRIRLRGGFKAQDPVCVYDLAEKVGVEVRFIGGNSFGGMYSKDHEQILVPAKRPPGRQAYTCAHELGHWHFRHGTRIDWFDELDKGGFNDPDERMADIFAGYLLMPQWVVEDALQRRSLAAAACSPLDIHRLANQLGVGYTTLIGQMRNLNLITPPKAETLRRSAPKDIRKTVLGTATPPPHMVIVDKHWWRVAIDLSLGDALVIPADAQCEDDKLKVIGITPHGLWLEPVKVGLTRVFANDHSWASNVRIARRDYTGRSKFRFLEDPDVDPAA